MDPSVKSAKDLLPHAESYSGHGDPEVAAKSMRASLESWKMVVRREDPAPGRIRLVAVQPASRLRILLHRLPQHVEILIAAGPGASLQVAADFRLARWLAALVIALNVCALGGILAANHILGIRKIPFDPRLPAFSMSLLGMAVVFLSYAIFLVTSIGGAFIHRKLWLPLHAAVEGASGFLEAAKDSSNRFLWWLYGEAIGVLLVALVILGEGARQGKFSIQLSLGAFLGLLMATATVLLGGLLWLLEKRGSRIRLNPLLPGLANVVGMLMLLTTPLMWTWTAPQAAGLQSVVRDSRVLAYFLDQPLPPEVMLTLRSFQYSSITLLVVTAVTLVAGFFFLRRAMTTQRLVEPELVRLQVRSTGAYRAAIGDLDQVRSVQLYLIPIWILAGGITLLASFFAINAGCEALQASAGASLPAAIPFSANALGVVLGADLDDPRMLALARFLWILFGLLAAGATLLPPLALSYRRRRLAMRLERGRAGPFPAGLESAFAELCQAKGLEVRLSSPPSRSVREISPLAHHIGLFRPRRFIEIPARTLERLSSRDLLPLLAHELAHHLSGDCKTDRLVRYLARATFVGDGFARTLCHSFGNESRADRLAVQAFGIEPVELIRALRRLAAWSELSYLQDDSPPVRPSVWNDFQRYYLGAGEHFWYPPTQERMKAIRELSSAAP